MWVPTTGIRFTVHLWVTYLNFPQLLFRSVIGLPKTEGKEVSNRKFQSEELVVRDLAVDTMPHRETKQSRAPKTTQTRAANSVVSKQSSRSSSTPFPTEVGGFCLSTSFFLGGSWPLACRPSVWLPADAPWPPLPRPRPGRSFGCPWSLGGRTLGLIPPGAPQPLKLSTHRRRKWSATSVQTVDSRNGFRVMGDHVLFWCDDRPPARCSCCCAILDIFVGCSSRSFAVQGNG